MLTHDALAHQFASATIYQAFLSAPSYHRWHAPVRGTFVGVGMDEVTTCEITVEERQRVGKGDQLGMFHFGGSSHCLLFRKGVKEDGFPEIGRSANVPVRSKVAVVHRTVWGQ
jgi:phosphatidylserine decarboxylase